MRFEEEVLSTRSATPHPTLQWFAVKTRNRAEMTLAERLESRGIECYIAKKVSRENGRNVTRPAVAGLLFVRTTAEQLIEEQRLYGADKMFIYFERPTNNPQVIPDREMIPFILITATGDEGFEYIDSELIGAKRGDKVRVIGGPFKGAEGRILRIKGDRRLVINIEGITAVATHHLPSNLIERIEE